MRIFHGTMAIVPAGAGFQARPVADFPDAETATGWWIDASGYPLWGAYDSEAEAAAEVKRVMQEANLFRIMMRG